MSRNEKIARRNVTLSRRRSLLLEILERRDTPSNSPGTDIMWQNYQPADFLSLHSNPSSTRKIMLDFDGYTTQNSDWQASPINTPAWSIDSDRTTFTTAEQQAIIDIWRAAAEDFAPFDVDVTTEDPGDAALQRTSPSDQEYGTRVVMGPDSFATPTGAGGIAFIGSFGDTRNFMCFVFNGDQWGDVRVTAQTVSHEVGHTLGLVHDGHPVDGEYYRGHGTGATGWGPIMGAPFSQPLSQWSRGEYAGANNQEDDLAIITTQNGFGYHPDDYGNTITATNIGALNIPGTTSFGPVYGVIQQTGEYDVLGVYAGRGQMNFTIEPLANESNLDILAELLDPNGNVVATDNPVDALNASLSFNAPVRGQYFVRITGTGKTGVDGYTNYGSLGNYRISGTVAEFNFSPVASDDAATGAEDSPIKISVLGNDTDRDNDALTVTQVQNGAHGTVTINADGTVTYTPNPDYFGDDTFTYTISDNQSDTDPSTATVIVTVTPVNDDPTANDDAATIAEDQFTILNILENDSFEPDVDEFISLLSTSNPAHGTVENLGFLVIYRPDPNYHGLDSFTYTIIDGNGGSSTATVNVTVESVVDGPNAIADNVSTLEDTSVLVNILSNDSVGPDAGGPLQLVSFTQPLDGSVNREGNALRFTPAANFSGTTSFSYVIKDAAGVEATAKATITVSEVNDPPVARMDSAAVVNAPSVLIDVLANDSTQPDKGETLRIAGATQGRNGTVRVENGKIRYTPRASILVGSDNFRYTISDGRGGSYTASVIVRIEQPNDPPVNSVPASFSAFRNSTLNFYGPNRITVSDAEAGAKTIRTVISVSSGIIGLNQTAGVRVIGNRSRAITIFGSQANINRVLGSLYYVAPTGFVGRASFRINTNDLGNLPGPALSDTDVIPLNVVNRPPVIDGASTVVYSMKKGQRLQVGATLGLRKHFNDLDADALTLRIGAVKPRVGFAFVSANGAFAYTPPKNFTGRVSFQVLAWDGNAFSRPLTVVINVA